MIRPMRRTDLPTGTVTFLFTDVEGSTRLLHALGAEAYAEALAEHRRAIREACTSEGGVEVDTQGDAFFFAFPSARGAVKAAAAFNEALASGEISVRVGLHTGTPLLAEEGYVGDDVHFAARVAACGHGGQILVSEQTRTFIAEAELVSLGAHRLKDISEPVSLYQLGDGSFPPLETIANANLPSPASSFLGREADLAEADLELQGTRLLTISGPGGAGKTRFALELARRAREERFSDYPDGVFACFLAPLRDPSLVLTTLAQTLAVPEQLGRSAQESLIWHLQGKRMLLLCDNLEHLLDCAGELSALLPACPGLSLLVTSRELLDVQGERVYPLPPLQQDEGVALFCERARVEPSPAIAELCSRLEGLPLAIELAAARLRALNPEQLLERLSQRLDLLKGGRDADPRQQTLRATIAWSYDLLDPEERRVIRALSVFAGGCTLAAAEEVAGADLDTLQSLLDKSLLRRLEDAPEPRYWMLETIREFAAEKLVEAGTEQELRNRHAEFVLALAEELEPPLMGFDEIAIRRLEPEADNIRAAIDFFRVDQDPTRELRLVGSLFRFWETSGLVVDGRRLADLALARSPADDALLQLRGKVLYAASLSAYFLGDFTACDIYDEERLAIARALGDTEGAAVALSDVGVNAIERGEWEQAALRFEEAHALALELGAHDIVVSTTENIARAALLRGDPDLAISLLEEQLEALPDEDSVSRLHLNYHLGLARLDRDDVAAAGLCLRQSLSGSLQVGGPIHTCGVLDALAELALASGDAVRAARLAGAVGAARAGLGGVRAGMFGRLRAERTERDGRVALGGEVWDSEYARGEAMPFTQAVAYALEEPREG